jgi:hypothetical protein
VFYQHSLLALHLYYVYLSQLELSSMYIHNELFLLQVFPAAFELVTNYYVFKCGMYREQIILPTHHTLKHTNQRRCYEYAGPRANHDHAGPEYRYLNWYATSNTDYV